MSRKTFIGYDLGDGESITDYVTMDSGSAGGEFNITWTDMPMLGMQEGRAVPTVYGYTKDGEIVYFSSIINKPSKVHKVCVNFKRRPTDLIPGLTDSRSKELEKIAENAIRSRRWPRESEFNSSAMINFRDSVVTFTNAIFENHSYVERVKSEVKANGCSEIVFCAGHPTKWNKLDVMIYELIMRQSILGKGSYAGVSSKLEMSAESRAAYLFIKTPGAAGKTGLGNNYLSRGDCALLIDVGSSTIDVTAVTADSNNFVYNHGNNYLGVRCIDFMIRDLYVKKLKADSESYARYLDVVRNNPEYPHSIVMACRDAKENLFRLKGTDDSVYIHGIDNEEIYMSEVENLINTQDVTSVLGENGFNIPSDVLASMRGKSWRRLFQEFLQDMKSELKRKNIRIGRIVITGGASWMPVVKEVVKGVFSENRDDDVILDMDPSRSISKGLALVGPYREKSEMFREDVKKFLDTRLPEIIDKNIPKLAEKISPVISSIIEGVVMSRIREWRAGSIMTINGMKSRIESDCSERNLRSVLENSAEYKKAMMNWASDYVGKDVADELGALCRKYKVTGFTLEQLNVFSEVKNLRFDVLPPDIPGLESLFTFAGFIIGATTAIMLPTIIIIVLDIIAAISITLASLIATILLAIPGAGWTILLVAGGMGVIYAAVRGAQAAKEKLTNYLSGCDLPLWVRKKMTDDKTRSALTDSDMPGKIRSGITSSDTRRKISEDISRSLRDQVEKKTQEIQYAIESR